MRFAAVAGVSSERDHIARLKPFSLRHPQRPIVEMAKQDVNIVAAQNDMVPSEMRRVIFWNRHIGKTVYCDNHRTIARRDDCATENEVTAWVGRHYAVSTQPPSVNCNQIDGVARAPIRSAPKMACAFTDGAPPPFATR
jgi:hypothetical protein